MSGREKESENHLGRPLQSRGWLCSSNQDHNPPAVRNARRRTKQGHVEPNVSAAFVKFRASKKHPFVDPLTITTFE